MDEQDNYLSLEERIYTWAFRNPLKFLAVLLGFICGVPFILGLLLGFYYAG